MGQRITSTVVNQSEYVAEKLGLAPNDLDIKKINKVFIKYNDSQEFLTRVRYQNPWALDKHPDYYKTHQSKIDPFFYIQDNSIFIYPAPDAAIANWLELYVIHKPKAITTDSTEDEIELPTQFHKLLSDWLRIDIYLSKGLENEANAAQARYNAWIRNMISIMKERYNNPSGTSCHNARASFRVCTWKEVPKGCGLQPSSVEVAGLIVLIWCFIWKCTKRSTCFMWQHMKWGWDTLLCITIRNDDWWGITRVVLKVSLFVVFFILWGQWLLIIGVIYLFYARS